MVAKVQDRLLLQLPLSEDGQGRPPRKMHPILAPWRSQHHPQTTSYILTTCLCLHQRVDHLLAQRHKLSVSRNSSHTKPSCRVLSLCEKAEKTTQIETTKQPFFVRSELLDSKLITHHTPLKNSFTSSFTPRFLFQKDPEIPTPFPQVYGPSPPNLLVGTNHCILRISLLSVVPVSVCTKHTPGKGLKIRKDSKPQNAGEKKNQAYI